MEMESGSTPRSVLLSKGSKMSSRMLVGCKTYPHWPLDMNKAWFICMGLSGEQRQEMEGGDLVALSTSQITKAVGASREALVCHGLTAAYARARAMRCLSHAQSAQPPSAPWVSPFFSSLFFHLSLCWL